MTSPARLSASILWSNLRRTAFGLVLVGALTMITSQAQAQIFNVIHTFTGANDGGNPMAGVTVGAGKLYGTASAGGVNNNGVVFKVARRGSGWVLEPIYQFSGFNDGSRPQASVVIGPNAALYGTTDAAGGHGDGTVFELTPPSTVCTAVLCFWDEAVLHSFTDGSDGGFPTYGTLVFDQAGNLYGTTYEGGTYNGGVAFKLEPSGGSWTETVLHNFGNGSDGVYPQAGVIFDTTGNLYGTTGAGGGACSGCGMVYQLTPSNESWIENILTNFGDPNNDGSAPASGLVMDRSGNLYGTTSTGGSGGGGTVFELTPSNGQWNFSVLYSFSGSSDFASGLAIDAAGNLYGEIQNGGRYQVGMIFKLTYSNGMWTLHDLHDFTRDFDGGSPMGGVVLDADGNIYGTAFDGGGNLGCDNHGGCGVVWEITP